MISLTVSSKSEYLRRQHFSPLSISTALSFAVLYASFLLCTFLAWAVAFAEPAYALKTIWSIDKERSSIEFKVKNMMVKTVCGQFTNFFGTVDYDGVNLDRANVAAEIQIASIDTKDARRDKHLKTRDFFDVAVFPSISYQSNKIVEDSRGAFKIFGNLSMHGVSRNVMLQATPLKAVAEKASDINSITGDAYAQVSNLSQGGATSTSRRLSTTATARLDRKDFGISMGPMDRGGTLVGDQVKIILDIQLVQVTASTNPKPHRSIQDRYLTVILPR
ncbi:MAG: YceI family protein [Cyanobacteria bacterium REEB67]|nr:YceI family protein [Cyanobacteria bacterium REEB67]